MTAARLRRFSESLLEIVLRRQEKLAFGRASTFQLKREVVFGNLTSTGGSRPNSDTRRIWVLTAQPLWFV